MPKKGLISNLSIYCSMGAIAKDEQNMLTPFEAATKMLNKKDFNNLPLHKKLNLFFIDFEILPLLIYENYLTAYGQNQALEDVKRMALSADSISVGDCLNTSMRTDNEWTLLPNVGMCSCVYPSTLSCGFVPIAKFPQYKFLQNSKIDGWESL